MFWGQVSNRVTNLRMEMFTVDDHLVPGIIFINHPFFLAVNAHDGETPYFAIISFLVISLGINTFSLRISWSAVSMYGSSVCVEGL
jgi:hypothetical protein